MKESGRELGTIGEVDSLRIEHSVISPTEQENYAKLTRLFQDEFEDQFGEFITPENKSKNKDLSQRVIVTNNESASLLDAYYDYKQSPSLAEDDTVVGLYMKPAHFIVINQEGPDRITSILGKEYEADVRREYSPVTTLAHEVSHAYLNWNLPHLFTEVAAHFYSHELLEGLGIPTSLLSSSEIVVKVFEQALGLYGDWLHTLALDSVDLPSEIKDSLEELAIKNCQEDKDLSDIVDFNN